MALPRLELVELEDEPWFPAVIRDLATDYLRQIEARFELHRPILEPLRRVLDETGEQEVIDLCSGGSGPIAAPDREFLAEGRVVRFTLTDLYPNVDAFRLLAETAPDRITFEPEPVDARSTPSRLRGVRTMFNAFHHFKPTDGVEVLRDAVRARQPICIFEIAERSFRSLIPLFVLTPLLVLLVTPTIRPFTWPRFFWTYVIPLVPFTCWWDGIVSQLRAYTPAELERLAAQVGDDSYTWRAGRQPIGSAPGNLTYLIGIPNERPTPTVAARKLTEGA